MPPDETEPLRERLENVEHRLEAALGEVCDDTTGGGVRKPDTGELIRMDETLTLAAQAARQAILLRRQLRKNARDAKDLKTAKSGKKNAKQRPGDGGDQPSSSTGG